MPAQMTPLMRQPVEVVRRIRYDVYHHVIGLLDEWASMSCVPFRPDREN
jgi:hypothetical protein